MSIRDRMAALERRWESEHTRWRNMPIMRPPEEVLHTTRFAEFWETWPEPMDEVAAPVSSAGEGLGGNTPNTAGPAAFAEEDIPF